MIFGLSWQHQARKHFERSNLTCGACCSEGGSSGRIHYPASPTHLNIPPRVHKKNLLEDCQHHEQLLMASETGDSRTDPDHFGTHSGTAHPAANITDAIPNVLLLVHQLVNTTYTLALLIASYNIDESWSFQVPWLQFSSN